MKKNKRIFPAVTVPSDPMTIASRHDDDDDTLFSATGGDGGTGAGLRVVHASPNAPAVDVYAIGAAAPVVNVRQIIEGNRIIAAAGESVGGIVPELSDASSLSELSPAVQVPPAAEHSGGTAVIILESFEDPASPQVRAARIPSDRHRIDAGLWDGKCEYARLGT